MSYISSTWLLFAGSYPPGNIIQTFDVPDGTTDLADGSVIGADQKTADGSPVAAVFKNVLRLAEKGTTNAIGAFKLPDLDTNNVIRSFDLRCIVVMNGVPGAAAGEGWSINFGRIPEDFGTGEGGFAPLPGGLTIAFDPFDNGGDAPSIEVFVGGVSVANFPRAFSIDEGGRSLVLRWDTLGLDITFDNKAVCADLPTPGFAPGPGHRFAFTARTTTHTMDVLLDNVKVTTQALPVIETGGPIISEFVANNTEFEDEFAEKPDWLELLNGSPTSVDLTGWYLTDSKQNLTKWKIHGLTLSPYNYQIVFASGRDRQLSATTFLHAGFTLNKSGGFIALVRPDGKTIASSYEYGPQETNVAFGEKGADRKRGYMYPPSPGAVNTQDPAPASVSPEVRFSHPGGFITGPVTVSLSVTNSPGTVIRFTLDRTEPGPASPLYTNAIQVTQMTTIKARSYAPDHLPGRTSSRTFVMIDGTLTNFAETGKIFESNLPLVFVDSFGVNVDGSTGGTRPFRPSYAIVIAPDSKTGRASLTTPPEYAGPSGVHVRGESSAGFEQRSYTLELWDDAGKDRDASLLGMPADSDWVLYGPWSEKTLMRNKLIFDWMLALRGEDGTSVRSRFVEVFFNQTRPASGQIGFNSYRGIYLLMEKLKRGKGRLPIENLNDKTIDPELITGGYIIRKDKDDAFKSNWTSPRFGIPLQSYDPDRFNTNQLAYMRTYISAFETSLNGAGFRNLTNGYLAYVDPDTFIDAQWMIEVSKQVDGYVFSTYFHKDRGGRLRAGPLWDFNISLGNADYGTGDRPTGWLYDVANGAGQLWYPRFHADPDYKLAHWDRYWQMRRTILSTENVMATINKHMTNLLDNYSGAVSNRAPASIQNPVARHFRRWPRLGVRDWPNPPAETSIRTWQAEVEYMKNWIRPRLEWLDDQSMRVLRTAYRPPVLSHSGGLITGPVELTMTPYRRVDTATIFADGEIYYTLDNSDPRLPGGEISNAAVKYAGPLTIRSSVTVNARLYSQRNWSPLATATFFFQAAPASAENLVVSEIMFRPAPLKPAETNALIIDSRAFEYVELRNVSRQAVDLSGVRFTRGIDFDFAFVPPAARLLKPGESVVVVADRRAFSLRYPHVPPFKIVGQFRGHLDSGGETIALQTADGRTIKEFRYDDDAPWPSERDALGRSLVLREPAKNPNPADPLQWTLSAGEGGTPAESGIGAAAFTGDPSRDSDGDGLTDLFEFASGSDAEDPNSAFPVTASITRMNPGSGEANYFTLSLRRRNSAPAIKVTIEWSADLKTWSAADAQLVLVSSTPNRDRTTTELYRGARSIDSTAHAGFYRIRVQQQ